MEAREERGGVPAAATGEEGGVAQLGRRRSSRRGFLGWMGRAGISTVGVLAGVSAAAPAAHASTRPNARLTYTYGCCHLAKPAGGCPGSGCSFSCSSGRKKTWGCCTANGRVMVCGECIKGSPTSCYDGDGDNDGQYDDWVCSEYCVTSAPCN